MTAEEILDKHYQSGMHWKTVNRDNVIAAMKEYADQQTCNHHYHEHLLIKGMLVCDKCGICKPEGA